MGVVLLILIRVIRVINKKSRARKHEEKGRGVCVGVE